MPRNEPLWQQVVASRDDAVRAAYAQWLASQGALDRAKLITIQLEIAASLASGSAQSWVNSSRPERDARALVRKHGAAWKAEERHDTAFYYKGFPARATVSAPNNAKLRELPVEHVVLRATQPAVLDELAARGVRALTIQANHVAMAQALVKHRLLQQLLWLRVREPRLDRAFWDGVEKAAPKALLYVDADHVGIEDYDDGIYSVDQAMLARPAWRCPFTTWGPRPTQTRVLSCTKRLTPGAFSYEVSVVRDVERPPKTFDEVVAPETWDPEKE